MKGYKDLIVWQKSINLVIKIYRIVSTFPDTEKFCLSSQMTRAAISVPANIAEGYSRKSQKEYVQYLHISYGSLAELETYLEIIFRLNYISPTTFKEVESEKEEIRKMLYTIIYKLKD